MESLKNIGFPAPEAIAKVFEIVGLITEVLPPMEIKPITVRFDSEGKVHIKGLTFEPQKDTEKNYIAILIERHGTKAPTKES